MRRCNGGAAGMDRRTSLALAHCVFRITPGANAKACRTQALQAFSTNAANAVGQVFQRFKGPGALALIHDRLRHARANPTHALQLRSAGMVDVHGLRGHPYPHARRHRNGPRSPAELRARRTRKWKLPATGWSRGQRDSHGVMQKRIHQGSRYRDDAARSGWIGPSLRYLGRTRRLLPHFDGQTSIRSFTRRARGTRVRRRRVTRERIPRRLSAHLASEPCNPRRATPLHPPGYSSGSGP